MIRLYLVRHGIADDPADFAGPDGARPLTAKGRRRFRRAARAFARLGEPVELIVTSPLVRAVQTAELLASALRHDRVEVSEALLPSGDPGALLEAIAPKLEDGQGALLVGHDPQISALLARVADLTPSEGLRVDFRKGAVVRVDVGALPSCRPAQARWWMRPKSRDLRQGLPLARAAGKPKAKKPAKK